MVETVFNRGKLRQLLALETEYRALDFRSDCDLRGKRGQVELAKGIGAMSVRGGFLVIGLVGWDVGVKQRIGRVWRRGVRVGRRGATVVFGRHAQAVWVVVGGLADAHERHARCLLAGVVAPRVVAEDVA